MAAFPNVAVRNIAGLNIPQHDHVALTYHGTTNNINTAVFKEGGSGGATVATLTFTYATQPPVTNNDLLVSVTRS